MAKRRVEKRKDVAEYSNQPLNDNEKASIWAVWEESGVLRHTARECGVSVSSVQKTLAENPLRYEGLKQARAEERSARYLRIEEKTLDHVEGTLDDAQAAREELKKIKGHNRVRPALEASLRHTARHLSALRMVADSATSKTNLLAGDATVNIRHDGNVGVGDLTPEQMVEKARALGLDHLITPAILELAGEGSETSD